MRGVFFPSIYFLHCRSEVHECVDQDIMDIEEKIDAIQLTQLPKYLGRQVIC